MNEPQPIGALPEPPKYLSDRGKEAWQRFSHELTASGVGTSLDACALELLCGSYALYLDNAEKVGQHGAVWVEKGDGKIPKFAYSPYWSVMNRAWKQVTSMLAEFGMTPSSRSRVATANTPKQNLQEFLARKF